MISEPFFAFSYPLIFRPDLWMLPMSVKKKVLISIKRQRPEIFAVPLLLPLPGTSRKRPLTGIEAYLVLESDVNAGRDNGRQPIRLTQGYFSADCSEVTFTCCQALPSTNRQLSGP